MIQPLLDFINYIFEFFTFRRKPDDYTELNKEELYI
jgi:hypothetical protein